MEDRSKQPKKPDGAMKDLPDKAVTPQKADKVKGGLAGGDDDDLEELQVQY